MTRNPASKNRISLVVFLLGIFLALIGLLAIYDASVVEGFKDFNDKFHFVKQQSTWLAIGIVVSLITSSIPVGLLKKYAHIIFAISFILLVIVLIPGVGSKFLGARRWLVFGPIVLQPSELIKIALIIYLSKWLEVPRQLKHFIMILGVNLGLIMLQPDMGTGLIVISVCLAIYLVSGAPLKEIFVFVSLLAVSLGVLIISSPYRLDRLKTFLDPSSDPQGASYHINQVLYGLGSGGFTGVGLGKSRQKFAFLPEATTDSIFVIIAEEMGFIGGVGLILLLLSLSVVGIKIALSATDRFDILLASGVSILFLVQTFVNIGAMTATVPLTGVPLPFISYGGSSLVTNFISLGLLVGVAKRL